MVSETRALSLSTQGTVLSTQGVCHDSQPEGSCLILPQLREAASDQTKKVKSGKCREGRRRGGRDGQALHWVLHLDYLVSPCLAP